MKPLAESGDVAAEVCRLIGAAPCDGRSALHNAAYKGHTECIPFLIELGASVSDIGCDHPGSCIMPNNFFGYNKTCTIPE